MGRKGKAAIAVGAMALAASVGVGLAWARRRFDAHPIRTMSGPAVIYTAADNVRVLRSGGVFQSATYLDGHRFEPVFEYYRGFDAMFAAETPLASTFGHGMTEVLMLGGGGFAYPKHVLTSRSRIALDVVEIDPAVVGTARRWFFLDELESRLATPESSRGNRLRAFVADGRSFMEDDGDLFELSLPGVDYPNGSAERARGSARYDAIINDCFSGREPVRSLATLEAAQAVRRRLVPGGVYLANVVSRASGADLTFLRDVAATLSLAFARVHIIPSADGEFGGEDNYLVVATDSDVEFPDAIPFDDDFLGVVLRD